MDEHVTVEGNMGCRFLYYNNSVVLNPATKVHKFEPGKTLNEKIFCYK